MKEKYINKSYLDKIIIEASSYRRSGDTIIGGCHLFAITKDKTVNGELNVYDICTPISFELKKGDLVVGYDMHDFNTYNEGRLLIPFDNGNITVLIKKEDNHDFFLDLGFVFE